MQIRINKNETPKHLSENRTITVLKQVQLQTIVISGFLTI